LESGLVASIEPFLPQKPAACGLSLARAWLWVPAFGPVWLDFSHPFFNGSEKKNATELEAGTPTPMGIQSHLPIL
jgi:hypothetical protein